MTTMIRLTLDDDEQRDLGEALAQLPGWPANKALRWLLGQALREQQQAPTSAVDARPAIRLDDKTLRKVQALAQARGTKVTKIVKELIMSAARSE